jgi:outer membrane protein W
MKNQWAGFMVCLTLLLHSTAMADSEWGFFGSYWSPSDGDNSVGGGFKLGLEMVDRVQLDIRYSVMNGVIDDDANNIQLDVQPLELGLTWALPVSDRVESYLGGGIGYYFMDDDVDSRFESNVDDEWGFYASIGFEFLLSRSGALYGETTTKLFIEAMYRFLEVEGMKATGSTRLNEADLSGMGIQAGLLIGW